MLHLLGLNHKKLTYLRNGRPVRRANVSGAVPTKLFPSI